MTDGPLFTYRDRVANRELRPDPAQELLAEKLQGLHRVLNGYQPSSGHDGWKMRFGVTQRREEPPQGVYIFGGVGGGKSMLMDLFFEHVNVERKRRVHFHQFLQDVQNRFNEIRNAKGGGDGDPIPRVAESLADEAWLLCFDELQVTNIKDAMILGRLFEELLARDVVIVATSNWPPQDLYQDGLQRDRFLRFIDLISEKLDVLQLGSAADYRLERMRGMEVYHHPIDQGSKAALDRYFAELTDGRDVAADLIEVKGRTIKIPAAAAGVGRTSFDDLCAEPLGPADYLEIAERYHTLLIDGIPRMGEELKSEAVRFITLIDALYENKVNLICTADALPQELYIKGEDAFEFERLVSRLIEMQSEDYLALPHGWANPIFGDHAISRP